VEQRSGMLPIGLAHYNATEEVEQLMEELRAIANG